MTITAQPKTFYFNPKFLSSLQSRVKPRNGFRTESTRKVPKAKPPKLHKKGDKPESSFAGKMFKLTTKHPLNLYGNEKHDIVFPDVVKCAEEPMALKQRSLALDKLLGEEQ